MNSSINLPQNFIDERGALANQSIVLVLDAVDEKYEESKVMK